MFAISFDLLIADLKQHYGEPYNPAYYEIKTLLRGYNFYNVQGSVYLSDEKATMADLLEAILALKKVEWFRRSVRDIRGFKVEDWSDFTNLVKREE